ncbi:hypothetical protein BACCAP_04710 [Pseudoflavonifractor capillosus ATCC 29799]|uniref:Uncharacterized protein n=1 Tax=Pseudoflavonifractor capillosus ATCC 29799 TaxID=411467 RepID=A6P2H9_9FIRM|nr:hypothetical protein BACCAP_04710 [Pseudoflavonifractor capillosus ATCC 29799]
MDQEVQQDGDIQEKLPF